MNQLTRAQASDSILAVGVSQEEINLQICSLPMFLI
jgi:hypothetical protein